MAPGPLPVLVVGAGPTGLAAALELARAGRALRVIDRSPARSPHSKAIGVNPRTLELMEPSGATERLLAAGRRLRAIVFHKGARVLGRVDLARLRHRYPFMLALEQSETERILEGRLEEAGVRVEWGLELQDLEQDQDRVVALVASPHDPRQRLVADHLIGADGAHSAVRHALGLPFAGETYTWPWHVADVRMDTPLAPDEAHILVGADSILLVIGTGPGRFRLASNGYDPVQLLPASCTLHEELWRSPFRISYRQVPRYREGRVLLAGDAAHVHSPVGARGMNLGIEDGTLLAHMLVRGELDRYSAERHPVGARVIRETRALTDLVAARDPVRRLLRDHVGPLLLRLGPVQSGLARRIAGLA